MKHTCLESHLLEGALNFVIARNGTPFVQVNTLTEGDPNRKLSVPVNSINPDGSIVFNVSAVAVQHLELNHETGTLSFSARFSGAPFTVVIPVEFIMSVFAKEDSIGMGLPGSCTLHTAIGVSSAPTPDVVQVKKETKQPSSNVVNMFDRK